ncbi:hypothetical protein [Neorhizobium galegae]|uniref:Uncharacterized protein n=1 Tax=Neorhizobium galegae bv. orientalis str. HAMBI 540 TaxID=1028800 RepID=A0A068T2P0_NEOGA|nr:hypothetical protein [Neorhizobium galegae]KAB1119313.1 hypothetical protein F4V90_32135 [Neorhizobium galegae]MCQ1575121.1 hypothetical protein [Neorhizobium galegae]MCQ1810870.1 hypothetical protein [Neorhizobium galegae]MCQ1838070.1 hypothetical protein [Neorhizobium galegae]MCQ1855779.1 hypothetical protein [Neorhizobium galegae]
MDIGDFKTYALAAVPIILFSAPLTYWQLAKDRFRADQTWLMVKLLLIDLAMMAFGGCYWGDVCTSSDFVKGLAAMVGLTGLFISFLLVPVLGGGLAGQGLGWAVWRMANRSRT